MKFLGQGFQKLQPEQTNRTMDARDLKHYHVLFMGGKNAHALVMFNGFDVSPMAKWDFLCNNGTSFARCPSCHYNLQLIIKSC